MKLFIAIVFALTVSTTVSFPSAHKERQQIAAKVSLKSKEPVIISSPYQDILEAYSTILMKGENTVWLAAKEAEGILLSLDNAEVAKEADRIFFNTYYEVTDNLIQALLDLRQNETPVKNANLVVKAVVDAAVRIIETNNEINDFLRNNAADVLPQIHEINKRADSELAQHKDEFFDVINPIISAH